VVPQVTAVLPPWASLLSAVQAPDYLFSPSRVMEASHGHDTACTSGFPLPSELSSLLSVQRATSQESPAVGGGMLADLPPTRWSLVAQAGDREGDAWTSALDQIVTAYRPVLVRHLIANMHLPPDRSEDLVQAFLADRILDRNVLRQAAREKGHLRSFLLKVFGNFVIGELRRQHALKRRPASSDAVTLDDLPELRSGETSLADAFDTVWARQILARTLDRMRDECRSKDRQAIWGIFEARILGPLLDQTNSITYEQLIKQFGLRSPSEASNLLITAKRMFARVLHAVVRETVAKDRDVEAEIRELKHVLAKL